MTNVIGVIVLLSIFVLIHIVAALQSFRMISLIPHHLPRLIGFASGGRVDMEQYTRDAALIGIGGTMAKIEQGARGSMKAISPQQAQIAGLPRHASNSDNGARYDGMDSTLRAQTDNPGPRDSEEA